MPNITADTMPKAVQFMNTGIVKKLTGYTITSVKGRPLPVKAVCNRDEWFSVLGAKLDCPILLPRILSLSLVDLLAAPFLQFFYVLPTYFLVNNLVYEKEKKIRRIMIMMGLNQKTYWLTTFCYEYFKYLIQMIIILICGNLAGLEYFSIHDQKMVYLMIMIWGVAMFLFATFLSSLFVETRTANAVTLLLLLSFLTLGSNIYWMSQQTAGHDDYSFYMLVPHFVLIRWSTILARSAIMHKSITFENWGEMYDGALPHCAGLMVAHVIVWGFLTWYVENSQGPFGKTFILQKQFWKTFYRDYFKKSTNKAMEEISLTKLKKYEEISPKVKDLFRRPADCEDEYKKVISQLENMNEDSNVPKDETVIVENGEESDERYLKVINLHQAFTSSLTGKENIAVKSLSFGVRKNECFGLLGHNGAGKSTTIHMLTGLLKPGAGTAFVGNNNLVDDMNEIYKVMGVCPQHDILWETLSAEEHTSFYARIKGQTEAEVKKMSKQMLASVSLLNVKDNLCGTFSGGMKRRLSIANCLVGNPTLVYMDEPSTGLDPGAKHQLWDVIQEAKKSKSMVLTTHSMEEADVLCDRIGVMAEGEMQAVGYPYELKRRFGRGYTLNIMVKTDTPNRDQLVEQFVMELFPTAKLLNDPISGLSKFEVSRKEVVVSQVFHTIEKNKESLGILSWALMETTMEEVFMKLALVAKEFENSQSKYSSLYENFDGKYMADRIEHLERQVGDKV